MSDYKYANDSEIWGIIEDLSNATTREEIEDIVKSNDYVLVNRGEFAGILMQTANDLVDYIDTQIAIVDAKYESLLSSLPKEAEKESISKLNKFMDDLEKEGSSNE